MADEIVIGKIGLTPKGEYIPGELYDILDMVSHEGNSYVSKIQNNEADVTNTEAWLLAAKKGEDGLSIKGDKGDTFTFNDLTTEQKEELKGDVIAYNSLAEVDKNDLASRVPIVGIVEEGNTQAVSGGEVWNATRNLNEANLSDSYNYRGVLTVNPNTLLKTGLYILTSASPNIPKATTILIEVNVYGTRITQQARTLSIASESWVRGGDISNIENLNWGIDIAPLSITNNLIANSTITSNKIAPKSINNSNLASDYDYRGFIFGPENDADNIIDSGLYYVASSVLNLPKRNYFGLESVSVLLQVQRYNTRIIQIARPINYPNEIYYRYTDSTFVGKPWIWTKRENGALYGKNVVLMGDSLTAQGKQHLYIWENTGADVNRIAIGGTTMSNHGNSPDYTKLSFYKLSEAIASGDFSEQSAAVANIYIVSSGATNLNPWLDNIINIDWESVDYLRVQYGTNDNAMDNPIGSIDRNNFDTNTYIGAFNYGVKKILEAYPHIRICVATPVWRTSANIGAGGDSDTTPNNNGDLLIDFVNALDKAAKFNHLPFRNYYVSSGINKYTNTYYLSDGTHPNDNGSIVLGRLDSDLMSNN